MVVSCLFQVSLLLSELSKREECCCLFWTRAGSASKVLPAVSAWDLGLSIGLGPSPQSPEISRYIYLALLVPSVRFLLSSFSFEQINIFCFQQRRQVGDGRCAGLRVQPSAGTTITN
jgi:hypothetical protein